MAQSSWWGEFSLPQGERLMWRADERAIVIERREREWAIWNRESERESSQALTVSQCDWTEQQFDAARQTRYLLQSAVPRLHLLPALADRSVVARLLVPLHILPNEKARIYVSTPLWFRVSPGGKHPVILDVPLWRPSDSWFGASTWQGEMCYAKYTDARTELDSLTYKPHRAVTPVSIFNKCSETLVVERISVPVPLLHIYSDERQVLWTNELDLSREDDNVTAEVRLGIKPPGEVKNATEIVPPRQVETKGTLIRNISSLFA